MINKKLLWSSLNDIPKWHVKIEQNYQNVFDFEDFESQREEIQIPSKMS